MGLPRVSQRAERMDAFEVMDIVRAARERDESPAARSMRTCHLEVGQPSTPSPPAVLQAARDAIDHPVGYTDALGIPVLRQRISELYRRRHDLEVPPSRIAVTGGASAGCVLTFIALADVGQRVAVFEPGYPCYRNIAESLGMDVVSISVDASTGYVPTPQMLDRAAQDGPLAVVVVASPSNPTGTALGRSHLEALHSWCGRAAATLVMDEIYHGTSTDSLATGAGFDDAVVVQSFSKYFCMTGWRLGWLVLPDWLVRPIERLAQNLYLSPNAVSQAAAVGALESTSELDAHAQTYETNRQLLVSTLVDAGVEDIAPADGAFYVWADLGKWGPAGELCRRWLDEIGVAATPGSDFDSTSGDRFVRFSVAGSTDDVGEAARRLADWFAL